MCGIVGYTGHAEAAGFLLSGLTALEYRGYDSAGIEVLGIDGALHGVKCAGRVSALIERCKTANLIGTSGIAHTRWATHGAPVDKNSHPHADCSGRLAIVHNGIIENHRELRAALAPGHELKSDTDSELIAHLIEEALAGPFAGDLLGAVASAVDRLSGSWALAVISADFPGMLVCARMRSPLVVASAADGAYVASDITPLLGITDAAIPLEDGQLASLYEDGTVRIYDRELTVVEDPTVFSFDMDVSAATLGGYPDFMAKEIAEQPDIIASLLETHVQEGRISLDELRITESELRAIDKIFLLACGTSYHVSLIAKTMIQTWAGIPVVADFASEFNYAEDLLVTANTLCVVITQSGETADTLMAARRMKALGCKVLAVTNVIGSSAAREADGVLYVKAGPEVCVASTKAYTAQMVACALLACYLGKLKGTLSDAELKELLAEISELPGHMREILSRSWQAKSAAKAFVNKHSALFLGRGVNSTTAHEGALKLKEISYLHAEAYPAGEMKHGPIALIEEGFPVVVIVPRDRLREKTLSNVQEVKARGGIVIAVATDGDDQAASEADHVLWIPEIKGELCIPIAAVLHLQLLARYVARARGCDVDKPRNLAKSVTVE